MIILNFKNDIHFFIKTKKKYPIKKQDIKNIFNIRILSRENFNKKIGTFKKILANDSKLFKANRAKYKLR